MLSISSISDGQYMLFDVQLEDGDIICYQKVPTPQVNEECRFPDIPSFLEYVHNRQVSTYALAVSLISD